jgi:hypothetical protein
MKTATSLGLVALGAIFAFAITRSPSFLNLQVVGWVLMLTGAAGAIIPRRGSGWLRRRVVVRDEEAAEDEPAATTAAQPQRQRFSRLLVPGGLLSSRHPSLQSAGRVEQETIEEYVEE